MRKVRNFRFLRKFSRFGFALDKYVNTNLAAKSNTRHSDFLEKLCLQNLGRLEPLGLVLSSEY